MSEAQAAPAPMTAKRRGAHLVMLAFAVVIVLIAYANVAMVTEAEQPANILMYGVILGVLIAIAYLVLARFAPWADPLLLPLVTLVNGLGLVMIYRIQIARERLGEQLIAQKAIERGDLAGFVGASPMGQLLWTTVGIALFAGTLLWLRDHRFLQRLTYTAAAAGLFLLVLPMFPFIGREFNGSRVWIGIEPFTMQPGEFAKLALVIFFAGYLVAKKDVLALAGRRFLLIDLPRVRDLGPIIVVWAISILILVGQKDLGSSLLIFGAFLAMIYVATERTSWVIIGVLLFLGGAMLAGLVFDHVAQRFEVWLDPDPFYFKVGGSEQLMQGLFAMGSGGVLGTGLGQGHPEIIPLAFSDFIIPATAEEIGLTGLMAILLIYGLIVERGLRISITARDPFSKLLAGGLAFILAWQIFIIVGGVTRLIPLTGLVTPFMSQGGSALLANWILIALLVRMSDSARRPAPQAVQSEGMTQVVKL